MSNGQRVTTIAIAKRLGVSRSTVSNVLNFKSERGYSDKTKKQVIEMADELGYRVGVMARAIGKPLKHLVFLASGVTSLRVKFMEELMSGIREAARDYEYTITTNEPRNHLTNVQDFKKEWNEISEKCIRLVHSKVVHGLIIDNAHFGNAQKQMLEKAKIPFVLVSGRMPRTNIEPFAVKLYKRLYLVTTDHISGGKQAVQYLLDHGHKRIALISPDFPKNPVGYLSHIFRERVQGYEIALKEAGIENNPNLILESSLEDKKTVFSALDKLLNIPERPTAIFATDDTIAILAMNYLREKGLRIPADISIMGYGNLPVSYMSVPDLTTVNVPWAKMGQLSVEMLINLLKDKEEHIAMHQMILETKIVEGGSVAAISN